MDEVQKRAAPKSGRSHRMIRARGLRGEVKGRFVRSGRFGGLLKPKFPDGLGRFF